MTQKKLQAMSDYFSKRIFGGLPKIITKFENLESGEFGNFTLQPNNDFGFNLEREDPYYASLIANAPEYKRVEFQVENITISGRTTPEYTDPAWRPKKSIEISNKIKKNDLVVMGILLHELTHYYCWYIGLDYHDGNRQFERKLKEYGFPSCYDRKFDKESMTWLDSFDYSTLQHYLDEFEKGEGVS